MRKSTAAQPIFLPSRRLSPQEDTPNVAYTRTEYGVHIRTISVVTKFLADPLWHWQTLATLAKFYRGDIYAEQCRKVKGYIAIYQATHVFLRVIYHLVLPRILSTV